MEFQEREPQVAAALPGKAKLMAQPSDASGRQEPEREKPTEPGEVAVLLTSNLNFPDPGNLEGIRGRNKVSSLSTCA